MICQTDVQLILYILTGTQAVFVVLPSGCKDHTKFSADMVNKLGKYGLRPGLNDGKVKMYIAASDNGWMKQHHMVAFTQLMGSCSGAEKWWIITEDNWHYFKGSCHRKDLLNR